MFDFQSKRPVKWDLAGLLVRESLTANANVLDSSLSQKTTSIKWELAEWLQLLTAIANVLVSLSLKPQAIKWDLAECLERLAANANVVGSIPASSDTVEF